MDKKTREVAKRDAQQLAIRDMADNLAVQNDLLAARNKTLHQQNYMLYYLNIVLSLITLFGVWLYLKLDGMNVLSRLIM